MLFGKPKDFSETSKPLTPEQIKKVLEDYNKEYPSPIDYDDKTPDLDDFDLRQQTEDDYIRYGNVR